MTHPLFQRLIDYAGVFPPARLDREEAASRYTAARRGPYGWILGPFLLPSSQLPAPAGVEPVGAVFDGALPSGLLPLHLEMAVPEGERLESVEAARTGVVFVESRGTDPEAHLSQIAQARRTGRDVRAKIRTGGPTPAAFPDVDVVGRFITRCTTEGVPFKATAGLHRPFRAASAEVPGATEHGYINLLAAVRTALAGGDVVACLADGDPGSFDVETATWRGVGAEVAATDVRSAFNSFGSCSFDEPVDHLVSLGALHRRPEPA